MMLNKQKIASLKGPILVIGASGFVGANLFRKILQVRDDCYGTLSRVPAWRIADLPQNRLVNIDLLVESNQIALIRNINPQTIFDCAAYGAYSFQSEQEKIYKTNFNRVVQLLEVLNEQIGRIYIHAGSSSEYGSLSAGPSEESFLKPNSHYSVAKASASQLIWYYGQKHKLACANLRFYSIYGPMEDSSRLIPNLVMEGLKGRLPPFVDPDISRDFIFIDDACEAFFDAAINLREEFFGHSFNVGSGKKVTIKEIAELACDIFNVKDEPRFSSITNNSWDLSDWYSNQKKTRAVLGWQANVDLRAGLLKTVDWLQSVESEEVYKGSSKKYELDVYRSISAIVACYKDEQAIPIMYERLVKTFRKIGIEYEIIFVNDCSPDNSEELIRDISSRDHRVVGISHSRNFGSQAAFRSGMEIAAKNAVVLLDGDLQDPPELIEQFILKWKEGFDVVYGHRKKREAPFYMQLAYRAFYYLFDQLSYIKIPRDAGDFSLIDRRVVRQMLRFGERDLFLRGVRAFAGFKQIGVDYTRPERLFGQSTNNLFKNIGWAKKGILSFSNTPLNMLSLFSWLMLGVSLTLIVGQMIAKIIYPASAPHGVSTILIFLILFGSLNLLAVSFLGEYVAKIFEEVKQRPHFIRQYIIKNGHVHHAADDVRHK